MIYKQDNVAWMQTSTTLDTTRKKENQECDGWRIRALDSYSSMMIDDVSILTVIHKHYYAASSYWPVTITETSKLLHQETPECWTNFSSI
jgi:hypothetical protein